MSIFALLVACGAPAGPPPPAEPSPVEVAGPSIYELALPLVSSDGQAVALDVHRGKPALVSMFYASCQSACPMLVQTVRAFEESLEPNVRDELRVLLVSLDPERDDPAALRDAASRYGADPARWVLARPPGDRVRELAAVLGIQYRPGGAGEIHHTSVLVLVDPEGRELARSSGPGGGTEPLRTALVEFVAAARRER